MIIFSSFIYRNLNHDFSQRLNNQQTQKNDFAVTPIYSQTNQECSAGEENSDYVPLDSVRKELNSLIKDYVNNNGSKIKDKVEQSMNSTIKLNEPTESVETKLTGTELMLKDKYVPEKVKEEDHNVSTMYCDSSSLLTNNVYFVKKDQCNFLQVLVPFKNLKTIIGGDIELLESQGFYNTVNEDPDGLYSEEDYMLEIGCEIKEVNKVLRPESTSLTPSYPS